ncbi:MAG TPA: MFS transporter, partial [Bacteroidales bacterium]|nr:MFS transporter [Bacteroidales bacterium]
IIGLLLSGFWADRWSRTNPNGRIFVPVIGLSVAAPCIFLASSTTILPAAILFFALMRLLIAFSDTNMMPILCMIADKQHRATGYGVLNFFSTILGGFGLFAGGALRDAQVNLSSMFQLAALILLICTTLLFTIKFLIKPQKSNYL